MTLSRILLDHGSNPFQVDESKVMPWSGGEWRAQWIHHPDQGPGVEGVAIFRRPFQWPGGELKLHVSADQRFRLFLDDKDLGGGPDRGDLANWRYHSWAGEISKGEHVIWARVWWLSKPPMAQCTIRPAFLCASEGIAADLLDTGIAPWEVRIDHSWDHLPGRMCRATGTRVRVALDESCKTPAGDSFDWVTPEKLGRAFHCGGGASNRGGRLRLVPAELPPQLERHCAGGNVCLVTDAPDSTTEGLAKRPLDISEHLESESAVWQRLLNKQGQLRLPAGTRRRILIDLG